MNHKKTNPAALDSRNDRRHIAIIVLLCILAALSGAAVQAYRVHHTGWAPNVAQVSFRFHGLNNVRENYERKMAVYIFRDSEGLLYVLTKRPNEDPFCFYVKVIERKYKHPFRNARARPNGVTSQLFPAYSTFRIDFVLAPDTTKHPDVLFAEDQAHTLWTSLGNGMDLTEIQKPYPLELFETLDAYYLQEYAQRMFRRSPRYAEFPIFRHDGTDPALTAIPGGRGVLPQPALPASTHRYARLEFGTPDSPLILADWIDGAKYALIYVVAPIILLDLIGYWGIYRMTGIRRRKLRVMRGECIRCGYPLMNGLCCECGLRVDVDTDDTASA